MALQLKQGETYIYKGIEIPAPYLVIDQVNGNKRLKEQFFVVEIYSEREYRNDTAFLLDSFNYVVTGEEFDAFFSPEVISADHDQYSRAYEYIKQLTDEEGNLVYNKWEDSL